MRKLLFTFSIMLSMFSGGHAQEQIQEAIREYISDNGFSGTILVAKNGEPIFHKSYGFAYYSTPDTLKNDYRYSIASITKMFTSIKILQLFDEGKLSLSDSAENYLPGLEGLIPKKITIHHLLLHISGLPNEKDKIYAHQYRAQILAKEVLKKKSKNSFEKFNYNNIDYVLLGLVIENLTGKSWEEEIKTSILEPLGMNTTGFLEYGNYPDDFAYTYSQKRGKLEQDPLFYIENFYAAGNMYSTSMDLLKLDYALYSNELLSDNSLMLLAQSYPEYNYVGYGVWNYSYPFIETQPKIMERRGKILGANSVVVRLTDEKFTIIILSNDDRFNPDSFGDSSNLREKLIQTLYDTL